MNSNKKENGDERLEPSPGVLYVVGTPIGNLGDLSPRARSILREVSSIACEDTRHSGNMLKRLGIKTRLLSFYEHNTNSRIPQIISLLKEGKSIALISDAGLPGISDPGEHLIAKVRHHGHEVLCIPGPCAAITALVTSGLPSHKFCFEGFLPIKNKEREQILLQISKEPRTTIIYEAPHRLIQLLQELNQYCGGDRPIQVSREITKLHEEHIGKTIEEVLDYFYENKPKGEFTLILGGQPAIQEADFKDFELRQKMKVLIDQGASSSEAAKTIAKETKQSKRKLYDLLHQNQD